METTFKHLEKFANSQGFTATRYHGKYKIHEGINKDYFETHLYIFNTLTEAYSFVQGVLYNKSNQR